VSEQIITALRTRLIDAIAALSALEHADYAAAGEHCDLSRLQGKRHGIHLAVTWLDELRKPDLMNNLVTVGGGTRLIDAIAALSALEHADPKPVSDKPVTRKKHATDTKKHVTEKADYPAIIAAIEDAERQGINPTKHVGATFGYSGQKLNNVMYTARQKRQPAPAEKKSDDLVLVCRTCDDQFAISDAVGLNRHCSMAHDRRPTVEERRPTRWPL